MLVKDKWKFFVVCDCSVSLKLYQNKKLKIIFKLWGIAQVVEHLLTKCETLSSNTTTENIPHKSKQNILICGWLHW
jgi:hypothetical protein